MFLTIVAIIVGAFLGGAVGEEYGAVSGAAIGWLALRSMQQARRIDELAKALKSPVAREAPAASTSRPAPVAPVAEKPAVAEPMPAAATPAVADTASAASPPSPVRAAPAAASAPSRDALAPLKAWLFGGNTIVKAGVGILFIGLAFLAKYASEHVQVPVELRLAGIAAVAVVLLAVGWRLRERRPGYAQVLQGGAVAVLYLTLFVAFRFYGVIASGPVFALMAAVAALAAALAVLQNARSLAVVGALGGFATPLLVSTGSGNHVALFSYYLVLDLGIVAVAWFRTWRLLNLIGFACTFAVATAWGVQRYAEADYASSQAFLVAFFLLFVVVMLLPARRPAAERSDVWAHGSLLFGLPTIAFALQYGLVRHTAYGVALSALALAAFYVALAAWMRRRADLRLIFEASLAIGTVFLTLVIPFALDARSTAGAWALEGAGLVWLGWRQQRRLARAFGYGLALLAGAALAFSQVGEVAPVRVFNALFFNALLVGAAALASALFVQRAAGARQADGERIAEPLLIAWGTLWLLFAIGVEVDAFAAPGTAVHGWLAGASVLALLCTALAARFAWPMVAWPAAAHAPFMALCLLPMLLLLVNPLRHGGAWAWPLALLAHAAVLWRAAPHWPAALRHVGHALGPLVLAAIGALLGRVWTGPWGEPGSAWPWLGWLAVPAALLWLLPLPILRSRWPVSAEPAAYRSTAPAVLALGMLLWSVIANIDSSGSARPLPYVPLVNPLDLGVGLALAAAWRWWRSDGAAPAAASSPALGPAALGAAAFVWVNAMLVRSFHHYRGIPYEFDAWVGSFAVQTGLTLLWTVIALALMWLSTRRVSRPVWMAGAVLLAAVVLKLLLVDQSGSGTVERIVSFIGVGVLMLVIGYVAPLPARKEAARAAA
jgi:uncharacterized membrane protein